MSYNIAVNYTQRTTLKSSYNIVDKAISSGSIEVINQTEYEKRGRPRVCVIQKDIVSNHRGFSEIHTQTYLEEHFSYPRLEESMICDKVEFTVALSAKALSKIIGILKSKKKKSKCVSHITFEEPSKTKFRSAYAITKGESSLIVFYDTVNRNNAKMKISYNPDKVHKQHLDNLISIIAFVTKNRFNKLINKARITRVDFAIDIIGIHISDLLLNKTKTKYHRVYLTSDNVIEAIVFGADGYNRLTMYDKLAEQLHRATDSGNDDLAHSLLDYRPQTRIESSLRPYKMTCLKSLDFSDYEELHDCFRNVKLYDESAMLNNFYLKDYFADFKLNGNNYVLGKLNRKQKRMLNQQLALVEIEINHEHTKRQQDALIRRILSEILSIGLN
jgi:hypothetical protein